MMPKLTLTRVANLLGNPVSAAATINEDLRKVEVALENTLSRDGSIPNQMEADLDLNNNDLLNVRFLSVDDLFIAGADSGTFLETLAETLQEVSDIRDDAQEIVDTGQEVIQEIADQAEQSANSAASSATEVQMYADMMAAAAYDFNFDSDPTPEDDWNN